jgi:hypothetical protein
VLEHGIQFADLKMTGGTTTAHIHRFPVNLNRLLQG